MTTDHIVTSYDQELDSLRALIVQMGGVVESQLQGAIESVMKRDSQMAAQIVQGDERLDEYEMQVDADVIRMLALRQPVALDLREVVSALKIASDLERMGDYAANVAKRATALSQVPAVKPVAGIPRMGKMVLEIIKDVLDAFTERDLDKALAAWHRDEEVDDLYTSLFRETLTYMMEDPRNITPCTHLLFIAKNIERIGDHATNIAENIHFLIEGRPITDARPKGDSTSFVVVRQPDGKKDKT